MSEATSETPSIFEPVNLFPITDERDKPYYRFVQAADKLAEVDGPLFTPLAQIVREQASTLLMIDATDEWVSRAIPEWEQFIEVVLATETSDL